MIAAFAARDARSTAELAPQNHGHVLVQTTLVQVGDERVEAAIELRQLFPHVFKVLLVRVPIADLD